MDPRATALRAVSRTDAGVHARGQVVAFDTDRDVDPRGWALGITGHLPREIAIVRAANAPPSFDPRNHALTKTYRYTVLRSAVRDPLLEGKAWRVPDRRFNLSAVREEARALLGEHDFRAFRGAADERTDTVRKIFRADVEQSRDDPRIVTFVVTGNRFLYRMVRIVAGTLVDVGRGRVAPGAVGRAITSKRREDLGMTAPAAGLVLEHVELDVELSDAWPEETATAIAAGADDD